MVLTAAALGPVLLLLSWDAVELPFVPASEDRTAAVEGGPMPADSGATAAPPSPIAVAASPSPASSLMPSPSSPSSQPPATAGAPSDEPTTTTAPQRSEPDLQPYTGLGAWVDVYDWSLTYGKDGPLVEEADIDVMADSGVQTLFIQASKWDAPAEVLEPDRLDLLLRRAEERDMAVVAWYLPTLEDPAADLRRLLAISELDIDALAVDIEARAVVDVAERNRRLVELSGALRRALPGVALGAIPVPPVLLEVVNPAFWPGFPWRELAPLFDVWLPMSYQSDRRQSSGYRDAYRYTAENIDRLRANLGLPGAPVHTIGGIANSTSAADVVGMARAATERGCLGASLYDWRTTPSELMASLGVFRAGD